VARDPVHRTLAIHRDEATIDALYSPVEALDDIVLRRGDTEQGGRW
jgi:hypothetical protein